MTKIDNIYATGAKAKVVSNLPSTPAGYYGDNQTQAVDGLTWVGGELCYLTTQDRLYIQTATSGTTGAWYFLSDAFATTTSTSTSSSTSTTSSTTSSTSSTSSSTSSTTSTTTSTTSTTTSSTTSTSTSTSSSTSTSTSTSSTTTMA